MNDVKQIAPDSPLGRIGRNQQTVQKPADEVQKEKLTAEQTERQDRLQVDDKLRQDATMVENARLILDELPEVREDKVALAKQRLAEGFYDRTEVLEQTAGKITSELREASSQRVEQAKNRLAEGYYDQPDVLNQTARGILRDLDE